MTPINQFRQITGYDLQPFFESYVQFTNTHFPAIQDYYTGRIDRPNESFSELNRLILVKIDITNILMQRRSQLTNTTMWELTEDLDDIFTQLATAQNAAKWLRVAATNANFIQSPEVDYLMQQNETIESISITRLGDDDGENSWSDIALRNQVIEEDYTPAGGVLLRVNLRGAINQFTILSVVDTIIGKTVYGLDLDKKIKYVDNDLSVLDYDQTLIQSIQLLSQLRKGDSPEFRDMGLQQAIVVGTTRGAIQFPAIFRQLADIFSTDDSLRDFQLIDLRFNQDALLLDFQVNTRLGETLNQTLQL